MADKTENEQTQLDTVSVEPTAGSNGSPQVLSPTRPKKPGLNWFKLFVIAVLAIVLGGIAFGIFFVCMLFAAGKGIASDCKTTSAEVKSQAKSVVTTLNGVTIAGVRPVIGDASVSDCLNIDVATGVDVLATYHLTAGSLDAVRADAENALSGHWNPNAVLRVADDTGPDAPDTTAPGDIYALSENIVVKGKTYVATYVFATPYACPQRSNNSTCEDGSKTAYGMYKLGDLPVKTAYIEVSYDVD